MTSHATMGQLPGIPSAQPTDTMKITPRRELRYALLAAAESCWVYVTLLLFAANTGAPRVLSLFSVFSAYWIALFTGRILPRLKQGWTVLQATAIGMALVTALILVRIEFYSDVAPWDFAWLPRFVAGLTNFSRGFSAELLALLVVIYVFVRGLGFGQRPLTLWFTGFQFRLGVVVFFAVLCLSALTMRIDAAQWIFVYFFVSLIAIALARMEESASQVPLGPRWVGTLLGAVALVVFIGLGLHQLFTLEAADRIVTLIMIPVGVVAGAIFLILLIPAGILAGWIIDLLRPLFLGSGLDQILQNLLPQGLTQNSNQAPQQIPWMDALVPLLKVVFVAAVIVVVGLLLARALNRRMTEIEEDTFIREAAGRDKDQVRTTRRPKPVRLKTGPSDISAESIRRVYAALVTRAAEAGLARRPAETPFEFLPRLKQGFPEGQDQIDNITQAYVAVHYGEHRASTTEVRAVRQAWARIEHIIKRKR